MTDEQRQEKRQSRERRDVGKAKGGEEVQETELKQQKRSVDQDVKNQDPKMQVQGEMEVDGCRVSRRVTHSGWTRWMPRRSGK